MVSDPNIATCPDYSAPEFEESRNIFASESCPQQDAVNILRRLWQSNNDRDRRLWQQHLDAEAVCTVDRLRQKDEEEAATAAQELLERQERDKFIPIPDRPPPTTLLIIPSPFATRCLIEAKHLGLWHFTNQGLEHAKNTTTHVNPDALLAEGPGPRPGQGPHTMEDLSIAVPRLIEAIQDYHWPEDCVKNYIEFFDGIFSHPYRSSPNPIEVQALIRYQAKQRINWHRAITIKRGAWNLGIISEPTLATLKEQAFFDHRTNFSLLPVI
ncbi:hypothetical protein M422DRAFT_267253 [Sphaerobolus stellatus SS14]|uniref:Uncharacterized protein n=1 Tax=Sphaerobolus stellatus (strain SS14) TaxID=990650 RepID=A0A0C9V0M1_SPHS4|nr:hypothetical protein M422DRAFT_267253 [Sphaerobolus stellatus SS14]